MSKDSSSNRSTQGTGCFTIIYSIVQAVFIVLKAIGYLDWTWGKVFIPTYIYAGVMIIFLIIILLLAVILFIKD